MGKPVEVAVPGPVPLMRREMSPQFIAESARTMEATDHVEQAAARAAAAGREVASPHQAHKMLGLPAAP